MEKAFKVLARGDPVLTVADLAGVYNAKKHPEVIAGRKTEAQILGGGSYMSCFLYSMFACSDCAVQTSSRRLKGPLATRTAKVSYAMHCAAPFSVG